MTIVTSPVWRTSRLFSRIGVAATLLLLAGGLMLAGAGSPYARPLLGAGIIVLASIPAASVVVVLADNVRRRDWRFVAAAAIVIALLSWSFLTTLR